MLTGCALTPTVATNSPSPSPGEGGGSANVAQDLTFNGKLPARWTKADVSCGQADGKGIDSFSVKLTAQDSLGQKDTLTVVVPSGYKGAGEYSVDTTATLTASSPRVHDDLDSNVSAHVRQTKGDYRVAVAQAHKILKRRFHYEHGISSPIETRGVVAHWDGRANQMTIWDTTQAPVFVRNGLAAMLGLGERQVRVIAPFVGGGFGPKIMMFYPEEVALPWIS